MIYVIKSIARKDKSKPVSLDNSVVVIKIGYTKDNDIRKRLETYKTHNKCFEVLFKIPKGTMTDEKQLHKYFTYLKYGREWFIVDPMNSIEEFFKKNKTIEEIREKVYPN